MPRELTGKQEKFAVAVVMGKSQADAYRVAYEPRDPKAESVYKNARRTRKHPLVAQRIAELQVQLMPGPEDMRALYQHALAVGLQRLQARGGGGEENGRSGEAGRRARGARSGTAEHIC
jgi:hypothetical protein